jgi:hypothetical protein
VAIDRCAALFPGMIPEASQAGLAATVAAVQSGPAGVRAPWAPYL